MAGGGNTINENWSDSKDTVLPLGRVLPKRLPANALISLIHSERLPATACRSKYLRDLTLLFGTRPEKEGRKEGKFHPISGRKANFIQHQEGRKGNFIQSQGDGREISSNIRKEGSKERSGGGALQYLWLWPSDTEPRTLVKGRVFSTGRTGLHVLVPMCGRRGPQNKRDMDTVLPSPRAPYPIRGCLGPLMVPKVASAQLRQRNFLKTHSTLHRRPPSLAFLLLTRGKGSRRLSICVTTKGKGSRRIGQRSDIKRLKVRCLAVPNY